jgi:hypothetical protein
MLFNGIRSGIFLILLEDGLKIFTGPLQTPPGFKIQMIYLPDGKNPSQEDPAPDGNLPGRDHV